jgi:hypothetical protein
MTNKALTPKKISIEILGPFSTTGTGACFEHRLLQR